MYSTQNVLTNITRNAFFQILSSLFLDSLSVYRCFVKIFSISLGWSKACLCVRMIELCKQVHCSYTVYKMRQLLRLIEIHQKPGLSNFQSRNLALYSDSFVQVFSSFKGCSQTVSFLRVVFFPCNLFKGAKVKASGIGRFPWLQPIWPKSVLIFSSRGRFSKSLPRNNLLETVGT